MGWHVETAQSFPLEQEYTRCVAALNRAGILTALPGSSAAGVIGMDGREYPAPSLEQVAWLFARNAALVGSKVQQGFDRLELTPLAAAIQFLIDRLQGAIMLHAAEGRVYQTRHSDSDPLIPARVNATKQVWTWETLRRSLDTGELVYFPRQYTGCHLGLTKLEVVDNARICAVPGWSVGLVESLRFLPQQGQGRIVGGRRQLEIGFSPRDYLQTLQGQAYQGETGKTLEDFITGFLVHLETTNEVSNDRSDNNAQWLLGHYVKHVEQVGSDLVPTGWWHRDYGRARLDAHRPGNRLCTKSWGGSSTVRLVGP
jgi:hypothetical protein